MTGLTSPGIYRLAPEVYHADPSERPSLSAGFASTMLLQSPRHAWATSKRLNPDHKETTSAAFDIGKAAHRKVLGKGEGYLEIPAKLLSDDGGVRTKEAKEWVARARDAGMTPLKPDDMRRIDRLAESLLDRLKQVGISISPECSELTALGEIDGVMCRAMVDQAPTNPEAPLIDLKTTIDANPERLARKAVDMGYVLTAAHYTETWKAATGESRRYLFAFIEKDDPYEVALVEAGQDAIAIERKRIARAREMFKRGIESGVWPGYPVGVHQIELPEWYVARTLDRESHEADYRRRTGRDILEQAYQWQAPAPRAPG